MAIKIPAKKIYGEIQHEKMKKNRVTELSAQVYEPTTTNYQIHFSNEIDLNKTSKFEKDGFEFKQYFFETGSGEQTYQIVKIVVPNNLYFQQSLGNPTQHFYSFISPYLNYLQKRPSEWTYAGESVNSIIINYSEEDADGFPFLGNNYEDFKNIFAPTGVYFDVIRIIYNTSKGNYFFVGIEGVYKDNSETYESGITSYNLSISLNNVITFKDEQTFEFFSQTDKNGNSISIEGCPYFQSEAMARKAANNIFGEWGAGKEAVILSCAIDDYYDDAGNVSVNSNFAPNIFPVYEINGHGYDENLGEIYPIHGGTVAPSWENRQAEIFLESGYYSVNCFKRFEAAKEYNDITFLTQSEILFQKEYSDDDWNGTFYIPDGGANVGIVVNLGYTPGGEDFYDYLKVYLYKGKNKPNIFVKPNAPMALQNGDIVVPYIMNSNRSEVPLSSNQSGKAKQYKVMGVEIDSTTLLQKLHLQEV